MPHAGDPRALLIADRLASLGTLVAGVAHEINNPITYVLGNLGELERLCAAMRETILSYRSQVQRALHDEGAEIITGAEVKVHEAGGLELLEELFLDTFDGATRIRDLVQDLLSLSRPSERDTVPLDVHEVLESTLRLVSRQLVQHATLERDYAATRAITVDRAKLGQVFLNLIGNAIHACTPPDPDRHTIVVRSRDTQDGIEVEVADSGVGIPDEIRSTLFEPFVTTKNPGLGTGLGLFISRQIIVERGGELDFRESPTGGTIFRILIPEAEAELAPTASEA